MKIFISYRYTGEEPTQREQTIRNICNSLETAGHETYCSLWDDEFYKENKYNNKQILNHALEQLDSSDVVLIFIKSKDKSEGMLIEIGYALAKKKRLILAIKKTSKQHLCMN